MIPESIFSKFRCVVFHVSDVPNARGGSPVQNQIWDGLTRTQISAIAVDEGLDTGDVYLKKEVSLMGGAEEIYIRSSKIIFEEMIPYIIENKPLPQKQREGGYTYKRRKPEQSELIKRGELIKLYDQIRMLDAEGYPTAFLDWGDYRLEFTRPKLTVDKVLCDISIRKRDETEV